MKCTHCIRQECVADQFETQYLMTLRWQDRLNDIRWGDRSLLDVNNSDVRRHLYRIFLLEMEWGHMQANVRIQLPDCVTKCIRYWYPSPNNAYVGYHSHSNDMEKRVNAVDRDGGKLDGLYWVKVEGNWMFQDK